MKHTWFNRNLLINEDSDWWKRAMLDPADYATRDTALAHLRNHYSAYLNHAITDVVLCVISQESIVPSAYITWAGDKARWTHENGIPVDYKKEYGLLRRMYRELNVDLVDVFIETMREGGIRPWVSIRMNDAHCPDDEVNFLRPDFFYEAREKGLMISSGGTDYGYFRNCFDYAHAEVRNMMLNYIRELVERYDTDGLELDFQRELYCFDYKKNPECYLIMNDFMREARRIVNEAARKKGHDILLMARVSPSIEDSLAYGFDVKTWAAEGLVDAIVPTPRWMHCDSGIPVADWKGLVGEDIAVFPGIETLNFGVSYTTVENAKAYAAGWNADGADGLYAFNMFTGTYPTGGPSPQIRERNGLVWELTPENCLAGVRDFTVLNQDNPSGLVPVYAPLPMVLSEGNTLPLTVGPIGAEDKVTLTIDFEGDVIPSVTINGIASTTACEIPTVTKKGPDFFGEEEPPKVMTNFRAVAYTFAKIVTDKDIALTFHGNGTVHYVNLRIDCGEA